MSRETKTWKSLELTVEHRGGETRGNSRIDSPMSGNMSRDQCPWRLWVPGGNRAENSLHGEPPLFCRVPSLPLGV